MLRQSRPERRRRARERHRARTVIGRCVRAGPGSRAANDEPRRPTSRKRSNRADGPGPTDVCACVRACDAERACVTYASTLASTDDRRWTTTTSHVSDHFTNHDSSGGTHSVCPRTNRDRDRDDDRRRSTTTIDDACACDRGEITYSVTQPSSIHLYRGVIVITCVCMYDAHGARVA